MSLKCPECGNEACDTLPESIVCCSCAELDRKLYCIPCQIDHEAASESVS